MLSADEEIALRVARELIEAGVPVFAARPALLPSGEQDWTGGTGGTGYIFPPRWQQTVATTNWLDPTAPGWSEKAWRPGWALGAVMGHTLDLLDIDPRNGGTESRAGLVAAGLWPTSYGVASTPSGGLHEFVAPLVMRSRDAVAGGLDIKSGDEQGEGRGFAFIAPTVKLSKVTKEPTPYRWIAPPARPIEGDTTGEGLRRLVAAVRTSTGSATGTSAAGELGTPIPHGEHDRTMTAYVWRLRHRVGEDEALALARLRGRDCVPPTWTDAMSDEKVRIAYAKSVEEWTPPEPGPALGLVGAPMAAIDEPEGERFPVVDWAEAWAASEAEDWILEPLIAAGRGTALYSAPKLGKSLLMLEVAAAVAIGRPVMGMTPSEPRTVLYVDHENDLRADTVRRLRSMGFVPHELDRLRYLSLPVMTSLDTPKGGAELLEVAQREGAALVVIDTVSRTIQGEENSNDTWIQFYRHTGKALKAAGIACVRLDHSGKDETRGQRGASAKSGDVDAVWQLTKPGAEEFLLYCEAQRMGIAEEKRSIGFRRVDVPHLRHERVKAPGRLQEDQRRMRAVWLALDEAGLDIENPASKSGAKIEDELRAAGVTFGKGAAKGAVLYRHACRENAFPQCPEWAPCAHRGGGSEAAALTMSAGDLPGPPRTSPSAPRTSPGGASHLPASPHSVGGGEGEPSLKAESE